MTTLDNVSRQLHSGDVFGVLIDMVCTHGFDACVTSSEKPKLTRYQQDIVFRMSDGKPVAIFTDYDGTRKPISSLSTEVMTQILTTTDLYFEFMERPAGEPILVYDPIGQTLTAIIDRARSVADYSGAIRLDASDYLSVIREALRPELIKWAVDTEAYGYSWLAGNGRSSFKMLEAMSMLKGVTKIVTNSDRRMIIVTVNNRSIEFCYSNAKPADPKTVWYSIVQPVENQPQEEDVIVSTEKEIGEGQEIPGVSEPLPEGVFGTEPWLMVCTNEHSGILIAPYAVKGVRLGSEAYVDVVFRAQDRPVIIASNPMIGRNETLKAAVLRHATWLDETFYRVYVQVPVGFRITITPRGADSLIKTEFRHMEILTSN